MRWKSKLKCECEKWEQNITKINQGLFLSFTHGQEDERQKFVPFRFCPWCGKKLIRVKRQNKPFYRKAKEKLRKEWNKKKR
ncbi:MAG: hypothetical protein R6U96_10785 [Promethearchaeia archaeon]